ncbi:MAG: hypothetical protein PVF17_06575, partial [Ignavibacteria bacterium]
AFYNQDNRIYETAHFLVYSDAATDEFRKYFATCAEIAFYQLSKAFDIDATRNFGIDITNPATKIQIVCNELDPRIQRSYDYGFMLYTLTSPYCFATKDNYYREVKHELTHVFQMYLDGSSWLYSYGWFREGLAEYCSGGFYTPITTLTQFNNYKTQLDQLNMHPLETIWNDLGAVPPDMVPVFYSMSGLAFRYLLDANGYGKSLIDIREMLTGIREQGISFENAFQSCFNIDIHNYEDSFYDLMEQYLSRSQVN